MTQSNNFINRQLSGGEKTMAGLALYATANMVNGTFFMVFDEADAFLDQENTKRFFNFLLTYSS